MYPDCLKPPKPAAASNMLWQLIQTVPATMCLAVSRARGSCSLCTLAPSPYIVLLAIAMASLAVLTQLTVNYQVKQVGLTLG